MKLEAPDIKQILTKLIKDVKILEIYGLMDYSLLFVVSYSPTYIDQNRHLFVSDKLGKLVKPLKLKHEMNFASPMVLYNQNKRKITDEFIQKMSGFSKEEFYAAKRKFICVADKNNAINRYLFDFRNMRYT